jgi:restriction endonuclease Mrr
MAGQTTVSVAAKLESIVRILGTAQARRVESPRRVVHAKHSLRELRVTRRQQSGKAVQMLRRRFVANRPDSAGRSESTVAPRCEVGFGSRGFAERQRSLHKQLSRGYAPDLDDGTMWLARKRQQVLKLALRPTIRQAFLQVRAQEVAQPRSPKLLGHPRVCPLLGVHDSQACFNFTFLRTVRTRDLNS